MHQLNKQTVDLNFFEQKGPGTNGQFSTELFIIIFLIVLGFVGLFYSLPTKTGSISALTTNTNFSSTGDDFSVTLLKEEHREDIEVLNEPIIGQQTFIKVPSSKKDFNISSIDFGDGVTESLEMKNKVGHVFNQPGKYKISVKVTGQHGKVFYLNKEIEVKAFGN
jgi:hypothetical protein